MDSGCDTVRVWDIGVLENPCQLSDWKESANFNDLVQIVLSLCNRFYEWSSALNSNHSIFCCTLEGISSPDNVCNINGPTTAGITKQRSGVCQQPWALFFAVLCTWASDLRLFKLTIQEWWVGMMLMYSIVIPQGFLGTLTFCAMNVLIYLNGTEKKLEYSWEVHWYN